MEWIILNLNNKKVGHKYKEKYTSIKDIYRIVKKEMTRTVSYSLFYNIIKCYFKILMRDIVQRDRKVYLPNRMGYVYLDERPHRRAFHVRVDNEQTKLQGKTITKKVPILDDFYKKIVWVGPKTYKYCKFMPLGYSRQIIKEN